MRATNARRGARPLKIQRVTRVLSSDLSPSSQIAKTPNVDEWSRDHSHRRQLAGLLSR